MTEITASRTIVKSPPELWAECSDAESLSRHLNGTFGEIRITRLEPETAVAWEGEQFSGTVRLEPSGWGTKVVLTAAPAGVEEATAEPEPVVEPAPEPEPAPETEAITESELLTEPEPLAEPETEPRRGFLARLFGFGRRAPAVELEPLELEPLEHEPLEIEELEDAELETDEPELLAPEPAVVVAVPEPRESPNPAAEAELAAALDSLGQAHHRPFSRG